MIKAIAHWFHHLVNPHCPECSINPYVELLKELLAREQHDKREILKVLTIQPTQAITQSSTQVPRVLGHKPWSAIKNELERNDFNQYQMKLREQEANRIMELEKAVGIETSNVGPTEIEPQEE